ncbi:prepilin-type N-terminal cleavage/methylation domain-containing protein [Bythopirellula polymerisocia]|uniref:Uncharacterized protein n=1 Tax=Bythopirellula polymerisocia TaxID=2528003 RepID=A0A5C6CV20_9BACT|nr:prepilin-type N-terminal cleavage/methylation domain-containing protein [Bythopirellula polymerisocia]TWU28288.1 hypothetical protein Pla144_15750 [Bythopirellula polymerisocia]
MNNNREKVTSFGFRASRKESISPLATRASQLAPHGMTLIELMVVVVILVTLVAGVLPLVSPNNDARKIREAARGLKTFLMSAQAEAARTGRPVGIGFRETSSGDTSTNTPGSGIAIEAYQLAVPAPFSGSSNESRMGVQEITDFLAQKGLTDNKILYGPVTGGNGSKIYPKFYGARLYVVSSMVATTLAGDPLPPGMIRVGDIVKVGGKRFKIIDDPRQSNEPLNPQDPYSEKFLDPRQNSADYQNRLICVWLDEASQGQGKVPPLANSPAGERYQIARQPAGTAAFSVQPSFQLPAGIAIDMQASGYEADGEPVFFVETNVTSPTAISAVILFSPNGGIETVWKNGNEIKNAEKLFLLVGRGENGGLVLGDPYTEQDCVWYLGQNFSEEKLKEVRSKVNWLNLESRWLMLDSAGGRLRVVENALVNPSDVTTRPGDESYNAMVEQIELAHGLAHVHTDVGGQKP